MKQAPAEIASCKILSVPFSIVRQQYYKAWTLQRSIRGPSFAELACFSIPPGCLWIFRTSCVGWWVFRGFYIGLSWPWSLGLSRSVSFLILDFLLPAWWFSCLVLSCFQCRTTPPWSTSRWRASWSSGLCCSCPSALRSTCSREERRRSTTTSSCELLPRSSTINPPTAALVYYRSKHLSLLIVQ